MLDWIAKLHRLALATAAGGDLDDPRPGPVREVGRRIARTVVYDDDLVDEVDATCFCTEVSPVPSPRWSRSWPPRFVRVCRQTR